MSSDSLGEHDRLIRDGRASVDAARAGMRRARIAVIGTGWWATRVHLPALRDNPHCDLVAVADTDPERARRAAEYFGVPRWYSDHAPLLEELHPDGVVIATPHDTHHGIARAALLAGADVLVEKPMTVSVKDAVDLVTLAARTGRRLHVGYPYPHCRLAQSLRDIVAAGDLGLLRLIGGTFATSAGPLYRGTPHTPASDALFAPDPSTYRDARRGGGQLHSQVTHIASLLFFVTNLRPIHVQAFVGGDRPTADSWDAVCFHLGGAVGTIGSTATVEPGRPTVERIELFGERGHATYDMAGGVMRVVRYDGRRAEDRVEGESERYPRAAPSERLVQTLMGTASVLVPGELGLLTTAFIDAATRSAATGRPATLRQGGRPQRSRSRPTLGA